MIILNLNSKSMMTKKIVTKLVKINYRLPVFMSEKHLYFHLARVLHIIFETSSNSLSFDVSLDSWMICVFLPERFKIFNFYNRKIKRSDWRRSARTKSLPLLEEQLMEDLQIK